MSILLDVQRVLPLITLFSFSYCRGCLQTKPRPPSFLFSHFLIMPCKTYTGWMYFFCHPVHIVGDPVHNPSWRVSHAMVASLASGVSSTSIVVSISSYPKIYPPALQMLKLLSARIYCFASLRHKSVMTGFIFFLTAVF